MRLRLSLRVFALLAAPLASACAGADDDERAATTAAALEAAAAPFCAEVPWGGDERSPARTRFWSAGDVQAKIAAVRRDPRFACTPHGAYATVYGSMTAARDARRCTAGDRMEPPTELDARLNDALSDLMTRNYLELVAGCVAEPGGRASPSADLGGQLCALHERAEREDWDALRLASASTGFYLSTHLTLALSTLPHVDALWADTPFSTLTERIARVRGYKATFDAFNTFLAENIDTVVEALATAGYLRNPLPRIGARVLDGSPLARIAIGRLRDEGFASALRIAAATPVGHHPWTVVAADGRVSMAASVWAAPAFPEAPGLARELSRTLARSRSAVGHLGSPAAAWLGAHRFSSLARERPGCADPAATPR